MRIMRGAVEKNANELTNYEFNISTRYYLRILWYSDADTYAVKQDIKLLDVKITTRIAWRVTVTLYSYQIRKKTS